MAKKRWRPLSLRARLVLISLALVAVALTVTDLVMFGRMHKTLLNPVDDTLRNAASSYVSLSPAAADARSRTRAQEHPGNEIHGMIADYLDAAGTRTLRTGVMIDSYPVLPKLDRAAVDAHHGQPFTVPGTTSSDWRVLAVPRGDGSLVVSTTEAGIEAIENRAYLAGTGVGLRVLAVLGFLGWFAMRAGLAPLRRIERTSTAIAMGDLSQRVPNPTESGTEIGRLSTAINTMLGQIETAFAERTESERLLRESEHRMRQFVAAASHELRTPLFGITGSAELYRMGATQDIDHTMARIEREARRLSTLVNDLLLLAQLDESESRWTLVTEPMDLRTLAADAIHDLKAIAPNRPTELTGPGGGAPAAATTLGDENRLRQVVTNLIGNAVAHTPDGSPVRIGVGTVDGSAVLEVADNGPGLTAEQAARVFERFYRVDRSRTRSTGGTGLGLAIAQILVTRHGGTIEVDSAPAAGATFRVVLPRAEPPD